MAQWKDVKNNMSRWMGSLSDSTKLSEISIPGTHDTMTWEGTSVPLFSRTQSYALSGGRGQLELGVRFLDIRLGLYEGQGFALFHGTDDIRDSGGRKFFQEDVLEPCIEFLKDNPSECILMSVKRDQFDDKWAFSKEFNEKVEAHSRWFYTKNEIPTLREVRGKIVLIRRYKHGNLGIDAYGSRWPHDNDAVSSYAPRLDINDHYNEHSTNRKWRGVRSYLKRARDDTLVFNFASVAVRPFPLRSPASYARSINRYLDRYLDVLATPNKIGIVIVDFVTPSLAASIAQTNFEGRNPKPNLRWFEDRYCVGDFWDMELRDGYSQNLKKTDRYPNDEFGSLQLQNVPAGWEITIYDNPDAKTNDDYCRIRTKQDSGVYEIDDFERDRNNSKVWVDYRRDNGLKGKVSHVKIQKV
uniref:1-phosphatidylinositol phosphodiesterase n=1 Tax=Candidatus Kentrum sp. SD TaxID=2126332 RepID=A0A450YDL2_9GAMM|nr:MAG: Phosphatidylinositol-specific phospholipase C, X domain [Candidatus Kentron sp. SD]VFK45080.1 MAG: Phosphatidylinositol-specific phospholipase C, X domain [Candidatus Kentron sp. SD]VFK78263.1 MAG: Phosphatidylinositol-specific phospholipase C, X domain [Candidatus Kentron sp. SD]